MLHMLHLPIRPRELMLCARAHGHADDRGSADLGYLVHGLLARLAEPSPKPFDIQENRIEENRRRAGRDDADAAWPMTVLAYAAFGHAAFHDAARVRGDTLALDAVDWRYVRSKPMPPLPSGRRLGFRLRACPTVRIGRMHPRLEHGAEVDPYHALMDRRLGERLVADPDADAVALKREIKEALPDREAVYCAWLAARFAGAASLRSVRLAAQRDASLWRRGVPGSKAANTMYCRERPQHHGRRLIGRREAVFEGVLEVSDGDRFAALLARGVGRHRAFGFGMLLLRAAHG